MTPILSGYLVDLVPFGSDFDQAAPAWRKTEAAYWASGGERMVVTRSQLERWHNELRERAQERGAGITFGIRAKDGTPIGDMGINYLMSASRVATFGAMIGNPDYWGGGYGTDALLLLIDFCFNWLDLRRVQLDTTAANARVVRQMEKVGFTLEARTRAANLMDGRWIDGLVFGLLREEWPGRDVMAEQMGLPQRAQQRAGDGA